MSRMRTLPAILLLVPCFAFAEPPSIVLRAPGHTPLAAGASAPIFFLEEPVRLEVGVYVLQQPVQGDARMSFKSADWHSDVQLQLFDVHGKRVELQRGQVRNTFSESVRRKTVPLTIGKKEHVDAVIEVVGVPPGEYDALVRVETLDGSHTTAPDRFQVRAGDEDNDVRRVFLRARAAKTHDFDAYEKIVRELLQLEPDNYYLLEELADRSIDVRPLETTAAYYREATAALRKTMARYAATGRAVTPAIDTEFANDMDRFTVFERVLPYYRAHQREVRFGPDFSHDGKRYAWFKRSGGFIGVVDPADPARRQLPVQ